MVFLILHSNYKGMDGPFYLYSLSYIFLLTSFPLKNYLSQKAKEPEQDLLREQNMIRIGR